MPARKKTSSTTRKKTASTTRKKTSSTARKKTAAKKTGRKITGAHVPPPQDPELLNKVEQCEAACHSLLSSRNKLIVVAIISWLITAYLLIVSPRWSQPTPAQTANQPPVNQAASTPSADCPPSEKEQKEDAVTYIKKIRKLLDENANQENMTSEEERPTISSVLTRAENPELPDSNVNDDTKRDIIELVYRWALSWELKNIKEFLSYYSDNFDPGDKAEDFQSWKVMKRYYIRKPEWIKIRVDDIQISDYNEHSASVSFIQTYDSPTYGDITTKKLRLAREKNNWKITRESGEVQSVDLKGKG